MGLPWGLSVGMCGGEKCGGRSVALRPGVPYQWDSGLEECWVETYVCHASISCPGAC